jgi:hypothetical protein
MSSNFTLDRTAFAGALIILLTGMFAVFAHHAEVNAGCTTSCPPQPETGYWLAGLAALTAFVALFAPRAAPVEGLSRPVNIWRRGFAFIIDYHVVILVVTAAGTSLKQLMPWTNEAAVSTSAPPDVLQIMAAQLFAILVCLAYFCILPMCGRATAGQYTMGYRIENDPDPEVRPRHVLRMFAAFFAACSWHIWAWFVKYEDTQKGNYWWDRVGRTRAVFVGPY